MNKHSGLTLTFSALAHITYSDFFDSSTPDRRIDDHDVGSLMIAESGRRDTDKNKSMTLR